jgi:hypothetical protein
MRVRDYSKYRVDDCRSHGWCDRRNKEEKMTARQLKKYEVNEKKLKILKKRLGSAEWNKVVKESQMKPQVRIYYGETWAGVEVSRKETVAEAYERANKKFHEKNVVGDYMIAKGKWYHLPDIGEPNNVELAKDVADSIAQKVYGFSILAH